MSIYIKGDIRCGVNGYKTLILMQDGSVTDKVGHTIGKAVEVPPHGRLVDADALLKECPEWGYSPHQIKTAPTIIPADREDAK